MVIESFPEGGETSLNLQAVSTEQKYRYWERKYHELPNDGLAEILRPNVGAQGDEEASIDIFLAHAPLALLFTGSTLSLQPAGLPLGLGLASCLNGGGFALAAIVAASEA